LLQIQALEEQTTQLHAQLALTLQQGATDLCQAQEVLLCALIRMAELRGLESPAHLTRIQEYVRVLAEEALALPAFAGRVDEAFIRMLERCAPLHDLGKAALPDHLLLKPGRLDAEERAIMESHTTLGAEVLAAAARQHGAPLTLLHLAADIARHHHERFDGTGYPEGLHGESIPLAARFVTLADVYDALRSRLVYKPGLSHAATCRLILEESPGQFDPNILLTFQRCEASFAHIFAQRRDT
jgi:response regulator RpfG family c-di-GMP phosphodiesterase